MEAWAWASRVFTLLAICHVVVDDQVVSSMSGHAK